MNWPNVLTLSRIGFAFILVYLLLLNTLLGNIWAAVFFTIASVTDFYDGYLAKKQGLTSDFGKIMDPIADKILILSVFCVLAHVGMITWWMVILIAVREVVVTIDRLTLMRQGQVLAAERAGKIKTFFQMTTVSLILLYLIIDQAEFAKDWFYRIQNPYMSLINAFMLITVILTIASGITYFQTRLRRSSG